MALRKSTTDFNETLNNVRVAGRFVAYATGRLNESAGGGSGSVVVRLLNTRSERFRQLSRTAFPFTSLVLDLRLDASGRLGFISYVRDLIAESEGRPPQFWYVYKNDGRGFSRLERSESTLSALRLRDSVLSWTSSNQRQSRRLR